MELDSYVESFANDLQASSAAGGREIQQAARLLAASLAPSARMYLLEALSHAAAEITAELDTTSVEVRLRGREVEFVVTPLAPAEEPADEPAAQPVAADGGGELTRVTLRLPEWLKQQVERSAAQTGASVNAWLVDAISAAIKGGPSPKSFPTPPARPGRRISGFAQA